MISNKDIVTVKMQNNWFRNGLEYALISWTSTFNRMGKPNPYNRIEKILLGLIAEKATENYLKQTKINYEKNGKTKWYETDRYDIGINNYAIDVKANFLDLKQPYIQNKLNNLFEDKREWLLKCTALVPLDQFNPGKNIRRAHKRDKVYLFPFIEGYFNESCYDTCLIHTFWDYKWLKRAECKSLPNLGRLKLMYDGDLNKSSIIIYGTSEHKRVCIEKVDLISNKQFTENYFFQVFSIEWVGGKPNGNLVVFSSILKLKELIKPNYLFSLNKTDDGYWPIENNWQSLQIHDCEIHFLGWIYEEELRIIGKEFKRFNKTIEQYSEIKVDNWGCSIKALEAMSQIKKI